MHLARNISCALFVSLALSLLGATNAAAQAFGKNKVHYEALEWSVLETPHLRLHYYAEEESLARSLAAYAESVAVEFDGRFRMVPKPKVPLLLYSTHHLFQQTNATPSMLSESVGGLTELIKGRVLVPHNGSWARLAWVTRHELAHWYMLEKISTTMRAHKRTANWLPDLWWIEGFAEYMGTNWDEEAEGLLRDMVLTGHAYPLTQSEPITGSVLMYKEGQSFLLWLAERYGEARIIDMLENVWRGDDFSSVFQITYGRSLADEDRDWFESLKKRYYPVVQNTNRVREVARPWPQRSRFNLAPRAFPPASAEDTTMRFCWFEMTDESVDLMISEPWRDSTRRVRRLLRGGIGAAFESFHLFQNRPSVSATGLVAVSAKRGGRDAIYLMDPFSEEIGHPIQFDGLVAVHDPAVAPNDSSVVFAAQGYDGKQDLYRATWPDNKLQLERLTNDAFDDVEPAISPDGQWVVWASDRGELAGRYSIWRMSLVDGRREVVSHPPVGDDRQPVISPDMKWIAYRSTRGGTSDLWVRPFEPSRDARRVTRLQGLASDPDWLPHGRGLLFTAQEGIAFRTWSLNFSPDTLERVPEPELPHASTPGDTIVLFAADAPADEPASLTPVTPDFGPALPQVQHTDPPKPYQRRLSFDIAQNSIYLDPGFGGGGAGQVVLSDMLGDEQYVITIANDAEQFGNFWDGWEGGVTYINRSRRMNYGIGGYRLTRLYDPDFDVVRREKRVGVLGLASYPFSPFTRVEASVQVRHATNHLMQDGTMATVDLVSNFVSFVHDGSRWWWDGPVGGTRLNLTAGFTRDITTGRADYGTLLGEIRHHRRPFRGLVLASRVHGIMSYGNDAQRSYLGGPMRLRIDDRRVIAGLRMVNAQVEARFPLLRGVVLAVPAAWMLPTLHGAVFADAAWAWEQANIPHVADGGFALFLGGGFYPQFRWNWVWRTDDFERLTSPMPATYFTVDFSF